MLIFYKNLNLIKLVGMLVMTICQFAQKDVAIAVILAGIVGIFTLKKIACEQAGGNVYRSAIDVCLVNKFNIINMLNLFVKIYNNTRSMPPALAFAT